MSNISIALKSVIRKEIGIAVDKIEERYFQTSEKDKEKKHSVGLPVPDKSREGEAADWITHSAAALSKPLEIQGHKLGDYLRDMGDKVVKSSLKSQIANEEVSQLLIKVGKSIGRTGKSIQVVTSDIRAYVKETRDNIKESIKSTNDWIKENQGLSKMKGYTDGLLGRKLSDLMWAGGKKLSGKIAGALLSTFSAGGKILFSHLKPLFTSLQGTLSKSMGGLAGKLGAASLGWAAAATGAVAAGAGVDALAGKAGVGNKQLDKEQDEANWKKMSIANKLESSMSRGIEKLGSALFLDNMSNEAASRRIKSETEFFEKRMALDNKANDRTSRNDFLVKSLATSMDRSVKSSSSQMSEFFKKLPESYSEGFDKISASLSETFSGAWNWVKNTVNAAATAGKESAEVTAKNIKEATQTGKDTLKSATKLGTVAPSFEQVKSMSKVGLTKEQDSILSKVTGKDDKAKKFLESILAIENRGNKNVRNDAVSKAGAMGAYQVMPKTGEHYGLKDKEDFSDFEKSSAAMYKYYQDLNKRYDGDVVAMAAEYNGGVAKAKSVQSGKLSGNKENDDYVRMMAHQADMRNIGSSSKVITNKGDDKVANLAGFVGGEGAADATKSLRAAVGKGITLASGKVNFNGLQSGFKSKFESMVGEYKAKTGKDVRVNSAKRSTEEQAALFKKLGPKRAAKPGSSKHETGEAIDTDSNDANQMESMGLLSKYGFTRPLKNHPKFPEPWHIESAGGSPTKFSGDKEDNFSRISDNAMNSSGLAGEALQRQASVSNNNNPPNHDAAQQSLSRAPEHPVTRKSVIPPSDISSVGLLMLNHMSYM